MLAPHPPRPPVPRKGAGGSQHQQLGSRGQQGQESHRQQKDRRVSRKARDNRHTLYTARQGLGGGWHDGSTWGRSPAYHEGSSGPAAQQLYTRRRGSRVPTIPIPRPIPIPPEEAWATARAHKISTKSAGRKWLVSGLEDQRYLSVTETILPHPHRHSVGPNFKPRRNEGAGRGLASPFWGTADEPDNASPEQ